MQSIYDVIMKSNGKKVHLQTPNGEFCGRIESLTYFNNGGNKAPRLITLVDGKTTHYLDAIKVWGVSIHAYENAEQDK